MSSPSSLRHSVSGPNLSSKSFMFSATSRTTTLSSEPSPSNIVAKLKPGRKSTDLRTYDLNNDEYSLLSPYYRGLTDQSLAINNEEGSQNHHESHLNSGHNNNSLLSSSGHSPYYKGLTDFSLVLHGEQDRQSPDYAWKIQEIEGAYECSPYYRGLTDNSLAIRGLEVGGGGSYGHGGGSSVGPQTHHPISSSSSYSFAFNMNLGLCLGCKDEILKNVTAAAATRLTDPGGQSTLSSPLPPRTHPQMLPPTDYPTGKTGLSVELEVEDQKQLGERVSEEAIAEEKALDMENKEATSEYGLAGEKEKKKPLRESVSISDQTVFASESSCKDVADVTQEMKDIAEEGSLKEYIWANKYQPKALADFICHRQKTAQLQAMVKEGCACNHFIFEGPPGVGKRTMIRALLREVFGPEGVEVTEECRTFTLKGEMIRSIQVRIKKSLHHVEVNLSETKGYEKQVLVDLFRETYNNIIINNLSPCSPDNCQAIIIYKAEKLSTESFMYIKWMLEKYKGCNKVFFCYSDESKLQTVKPLCTTIHLSPPSTQEIVEVLQYIGKEEGKELSREFLVKVVEKSKNNLRQAIRSLEATCQNKDSIEEDELILTGWEDDISNIARKIIEEQSPKQLYNIHVKLHSLMIHNVSPDFVYKYLVSELNSLVDESLRPEAAKLEKEYNNNIYEIKWKSVKHSGHAQNKERERDERKNELPKKNAWSYLKVEEFIAKFMSWYKTLSAKSGK